jgi:RND superfamily putative drug exporter
MERFGYAIVNVRKRVLVGAVLFLFAAVALGGSVADRLSNSGYDDPASDTWKAFTILDKQFDAGAPNYVMLVRANSGSVNSPDVARDGQALADRVAADPGVTDVQSYWGAGRPAAYVSTDGTRALITARLTGGDDAALDAAERLKETVDGTHGSVTGRSGGEYATFSEMQVVIQDDLAKAEMIVFPVTLILLILVFGSVVAALLPLVVALFSVIGTLLVLWTLSQFTGVSIFALNLTTALGLGLAIDYSLFIVSRYREELRSGRPSAEAIAFTMKTAGRTVVFSAATVALSLSALLVFPLFFLRSFAYAGIAVVALAAVGAVVVLPALLAVLGPRVEKGKIPFLNRPPKPVEEGFWHRVAVAVMRRPLPLGTVVLGLLVVLGLPFLGANFGLPDDRTMPRSSQSHQVLQEIRDDFTSLASGSLQVAAPTAGGDRGAVATYATALSAVPGVARVDTVTGTYVKGSQAGPPSPGAVPRFTNASGGTWLSVVPAVEPISNEGKQLVRDLREVGAPWRTYIGGESARFTDTSQAVSSRLWLAGLIIALATLVLLFLFTGSIVMPIKALVVNIVSLSATFGAMVFVFQQGHLQNIVGDFIVTGQLDLTVPVLMFCVAFGLSMDYEVFLLSRIKEEYDVTGDTTMAVAHGLEKTGRLVSAAAALIAIVFVAFGTSGVTNIKLFGFGLALAVLVDATLVRGVLVPAFMRLAGQWNWWAPPWLRRVHNRIGITESVRELERVG